VTVREGTNVIVRHPSEIPPGVRAARRRVNPPRPDGWDGRAGERVVAGLAVS